MLAIALALSTGYQVVLPERIDLAEGERAVASLTITPEDGWSISTSGPLRISLRAEPQGALELPRKRLGRADAADAKAASPRFDLPVIGARVGTHTLQVDLRFWLCRRHTCRPVRATRSVMVAVAPRAPPPPPTESPAPPAAAPPGGRATASPPPRR